MRIPRLLPALLVAAVLAAGCQDAAAGPAASPVPSSSPVSSPSPSPSPEPPTVTITGTGDVILGTAPAMMPPASGFFRRLDGRLPGDLVMGNLENTFTEDTGSVKCKKDETGCFAFRLPPSYAAQLTTAGFGVMNVANNHSLDFGPAGLKNTRAALTANGIKPTGAPGEITLVEARGIRIAVLGFSPYSWGASLLDVPKAAELVRKAQSQADLVVVNMQIGAEGAAYAHVKPGTETFLGENRGDPIRFARAMVDAGADLVVGHGPHVLRAMEFYRGRLIAYSMGNFAGYRVLKTEGATGIGGALSVTLRADGTWVGGKVICTAMVEGGYPALDPKKQALPLLRDLGKSDLPASAPTIGADGAIAPK